MLGTSRGVRLKLKLPKRKAWADSFGWWHDERRRLRVMSHYGIRQYHSVSGKEGSQMERPAMKWFFHF